MDEMSTPPHTGSAGHGSSPISVVALDAMGVLYRSADDVTDLLIPYARAHGSRLEPRQTLEIYLECSLGRISAAELWERLGTTGADDEEYCSGFQLTEGVLPALQLLSARGFGLACLSNDVSEWSLRLRRRFGLEQYITTWAISGDIGFRKPAAEAFAALARMVAGVDPGRILFLDDRIDNIRAARVAGMASAQFGTVGELDEDGRRAVRRMGELGEVVDRWS